MLPRNNRLPSDEYFTLCAQYIREMEERREENFLFLRKCFINCAQALGHNQLLMKQFETMHLSSIARKIDYEKVCNRGLYNITEFPPEILALSEEELISIKEYCNDQVMELYRDNRG